MPEIKLFKPKDNSETKEKKLSLPTIKGGKGGLFGKPRGKYPTKTTINLVIKEQEPISLRRLLPGLILAILVVILVGKIFVYDKIADMIRASNEVTEMHNQLEAAYASIESYEDIEDEYAHYTYSGMTEEELNLVDRVSVMGLVRQIMQAGVTTRNWSLTGNELTIQVTGTSLQRLNELSQRLERNPIVDRCVIVTANKKELLDNNGKVDVSYMVYLQKPEEDSADKKTESTTETDSDQEVAQPEQPTGSIQDLKGKEVAS